MREKDAARAGVALVMGTRSPQDKLFAADHVYLDFVGRETLYGYLAQNREQLFRDEDFAALYCADNGRTSVPPSLGKERIQTATGRALAEERNAHTTFVENLF